MGCSGFLPSSALSHRHSCQGLTGGLASASLVPLLQGSVFSCPVFWPFQYVASEGRALLLKQRFGSFRTAGCHGFSWELVPLSCCHSCELRPRGCQCGAAPGAFALVLLGVQGGALALLSWADADRRVIGTFCPRDFRTLTRTQPARLALPGQRVSGLRCLVFSC